MKKIWIIIAGVVLVLAVVSGAFYAGMTYGRSQLRSSGWQNTQGGFTGRGGQFPGVIRTPAAGRGEFAFSGGGIMGTIQTIEGNVLVISTNEGTITVETTETTLIEKTMTVGIDDLEVDEQVIVLGRENDDGSITARSIQPLRIPQNSQSSGEQ